MSLFAYLIIQASILIEEMEYELRAAPEAPSGNFYTR